MNSSLESLLKTTASPTKKREEIDAKPPSEPIADPTKTSHDTAVHDSTCSQQSKDHSPHKSLSTHHPISIDKSTSTSPCDSGTSTYQSEAHTCTFSFDAFTKDNERRLLRHDSMSSASIDLSSEPAYKVIVRCHNKLVSAISTDILNIAGILVENEFLPPEVSSKMLLPSYTPKEKATILVIGITERIKLAPNRFQELIKIFSEQNCTKDIIKSLGTHVQQGIDDGWKESDMEVLSCSRQCCEGHIYTAWVSLSRADKIDLEAKLTNDAEVIREEFALLCWRVRESFEQQNIKPRTLASVLLDLKINEDLSNGNSGISLLKEKEDALMSAKSVHDTFDILRPHMNFFNHEILQYLIKGRGSKDDKKALSVFLKKFTEFCKRHVFEVPFTVNSNGQNSDNHSTTQQRLHVKVTKHFQAAILTQSASKSVSRASGCSEMENICSNKLDINLEDAKKIQRKLAKVLNLKPSSLFLDSISEGSVILTFLLPMCVSLAGLDNNPEIALLSSNGIIILCGPPGKSELEKLITNGIMVKWSQPEYGCDSVKQYIVYYQKKCEDEASKWKKIELPSLETCTQVPNLNIGERYVFMICAVSDGKILQYSGESDPIGMYKSEISMRDIYTAITTANSMCHEMITLCLSLSDCHELATSLLAKKMISAKHRAEITAASMPNEKAKILSATIHKRIKSEPDKFQEILNIFSKESQADSVMETMQSVFHHSVCIQYAGYLKFLYTSLLNKEISNQWPPSVTHNFFRLAMIKTGTVIRNDIDKFVQLTITGKVDDILHQKYPIQLEDIFKDTECERKVILLEGGPGCGKSTLSVYICQQWEKDQLFNQFQLIILVQLRDPAVQSARCLADVLPCPDAETAQLLARILMKMKCQDVLFILDGWDELSSPNHIFHDLVNSRLPYSNSFSKSTVIVTSRPISSGDLYPYVSSRVEILGFTQEELHQFFTECLRGDTKAVKTLLEKIEENPEVASSCYLPLNATILVHLFKSDCNTFPTTLYGIFSSLVLNCIERHLNLRTQCKNISIESIDQLPELVKKPFLGLCQLAYDGMMQGKIIFTTLPPTFNTLSLLQGVESFIGREKEVSHNFIHLSIQELLAAWYIATQLPASEQVSKFNSLFYKSRFSAVFRFYAAVTKLKTPGIDEVVINIVNKCSRESISKGNKVLMISLLQCLYEAQDSSLCHFVVQQLQNKLNLSFTTLTPLDCLCIGYFLAHVCKMASGRFGVELKGCGISDNGCKYLVRGHKSLNSHSETAALFDIDIQGNDISFHGVCYLSTLVKTGNIYSLDLTNNTLSKHDQTIMHTPFGLFAEQLKYNTSLRILWLQRCNLSAQNVENLAKALTTNKHLEELVININPLYDDGIQHLAHALSVNQGLKELRLNSCGMTDIGFEYLANSLQHNNILDRLYTYTLNEDIPNRITENIVPVLTECLKLNHTLTELELPKHLESSVPSVQKTVNDVRKRSGLLHIKISVWGW